MDKTKAYIKKMKKANELQSLWQPKNGDFFFGRPEDFNDEDLDEGVYQYFECDDEYFCTVPKYYNYKKKDWEDDPEAVWIPRQDDMQGMLLYDTPYGMTKDFSEWCAELSVTMQERFTTLEQLWVGFYMFKNHNMVWTGKDWTFKQTDFDD